MLATNRHDDFTYSNAFTNLVMSCNKLEDLYKLFPKYVFIRRPIIIKYFLFFSRTQSYL